MSSLDRYLIIRRGTAVRRFHTLPILVEETVGQHSCNLVGLLWALTNGEARKELLLGAVMHDIPEHITGDIPSPMKRVIRSGLREVEAGVFSELGFNVDDLSNEENLLFHLADMLDLAFKAREEVRMGNCNMQEVVDNALRYLEDLVTEYTTITDKYVTNIVELLEYVNES